MWTFWLKSENGQQGKKQVEENGEKVEQIKI
jgi:hypothetical protein